MFQVDAVTTAGPYGSVVDPVLTHTPVVATPRGVLVMVSQNNNGSSSMSVTYGGVTVPPTPNSPVERDAGVDNMCFAFFLGSGVPSGEQEVVVDVNSDQHNVVVITFAGDRDMEVFDVIPYGATGTTLVDDPTWPVELNGRPGFVTLFASAAGTGSSPGFVSPLSGWTNLFQSAYLEGSQGAFFYAYDTIDDEDVLAGVITNAPLGALDASLLVIALGEVPGGSEDQAIEITGVVSGEAFGDHAIEAADPQDIVLSGIASSEVFGEPSLVESQLAIDANAIASAEAFGAAAIAHHRQQILVIGIPSAMAFGAPIFAGGIIVDSGHSTRSRRSVFFTYSR